MFKDLRNRAGQAASTGMQQAGRMRDGAAASAQRARGGGVGAPRSGGARSAPVSAFLKRLAPNGQPWAEYCGVAPPSCEGDGKLTGAWGECMSSAVIFEICNPGWERMPGYKEDGAAGQVVTFAEQCGYGSSTQLLEDAEEAIKQEMEDAEGDPFAFLRQRAKNGMTWKDYTATQEPAGDKNGFVNGAWGDCLTAACIFEDQNPEWSKLSLYSEDGPAGQVIRWFCECGHEISEPALAKTEDATHEAIKRGTELPVYDQVYQCVVGQHNAQHVGGQPPQMSGRKFALLVGCNYAGTRAELQGCINDVHSWCEVLTSIYGFNDKDIVVLTDEPGQDPRRLPTLDNIRNGLRWLVSGAQPGDVLFWQFSGHGTQQESMTMNEEDGLDECLCPCDHQSSGLLVDDEIFDTVVLPLQSGVKLTIILDCCHSGTAVDLPFRWEGDRWEEVGGTVYTAGDVQMFSGCDDHQTSMDVSRAGRASGAMTMSMTRAIKENPGMNYPDLLFRLRDILQQEGYEQFPQLTSSQMFDPRSKKFDLTQGATPNQNPMLGSTGPPRLHPHRQTAGGGDDDDCSIM